MISATPEFLSPLRLEWRPEVAVWELTAPLVYRSAVLRVTLTIPTGFWTDLVSIPRWTGLGFVLLAGRANAPAVLHDYLYQSHAATKRLADRTLLEAMCATREPRWARAVIYAGTVLCGHYAYFIAAPRLFTRYANDYALAQRMR